MRIGILTLHFPHNYGAMLQAHALSWQLQEFGFNVEIIDYRQENIASWTEYPRFDDIIKFNSYPIALIKYIISNYNFKIHRTQQYKRFENFLKNELKLSEITYFSKASLEKTNSIYDIIICGSDQIWNTKILGETPNTYFLDFFKGHKIAYAASAGNSLINDKEEDLFISNLKQFDLVGVRESQLGKCLTMMGIENSVVLDPTLLVDESFWIKQVKKCEEKYILLYYVKKDIEIYELANKISKKKGIKIIEIPYSLEKIKNVEKRFDVGPFEFLNLFYNAEEIITNSYHGTCFSLIFRKKFHVIFGDYPERLKNILTLLKFDITSDKIQEFSPNLNSNYEFCIQELRKESKEYIYNVLTKIESGEILKDDKCNCTNL
ncbi:polysaccharide pyruvyl transferase family protein [Anaerorhabdus sp.]|uniref:polysaccharide pyruvyl transferase family protein n=1 Tax=Anaerorhabdus sp. TaxID=1872524 RepID=UPI002FC5AC13